MESYHFANVLLSGPCNLRCPACIGRVARARRFPSTLDRFPLPGLEAFARRLMEHGCREVSLTGIDTEPQLYRHQARLIDWLRERVPGVRLSLHTNGTRILANPSLFNRYDRATVSLPSLDPSTCAAMTGSSRVLDLVEIAGVARIPLKISILLTHRNVAELPAMMARCRDLGLRRLVLRKPFGRDATVQRDDAFDGDALATQVASWQPSGPFAGNPVYEADGLEITLWDFNRTRLRCLNLLPDGTSSASYTLIERRQVAPRSVPRDTLLTGGA